MKNLIKKIVLLLLLLIGVSAIYSGYHLMVKPDGSNLGLSISLLKQSYFTDFMFLGIVLFFVVGITNLTLFVIVLTELTRYKRLLICEGIILFAYIVIQPIIGIPYHLAQVFCLLVAFFFIYVGIAKFHDNN